MAKTERQKDRAELKYFEDRAEAHTRVVQHNPEKFTAHDKAILFEIACERKALCIIAKRLSEERIG